VTTAVRDLRNADVSRRATLRCQIAGSLLLALVLAAAPVARFSSDMPWHARAALADDGGGGGGGGGGGEGGEGGGEGSGGSGEGGEGGGEKSGEAAGGERSGGGEGPHEVEHELVAIGPDRDLAERIASLGISVVAIEPFAALGLSIARLRLPDDMPLAAGRALLEARVPGIQLDVNALYAPLGSVSLPAPGYAKRMIGWPEDDRGCGAGLSLGMIDTGLDSANPALAGRDITERGFIDPGAAPAPAEHGTAIAGILVGAADGADTGLLPAARLYVANIFAAGPTGEPRATAVGFVGALDWLVGAGVRAINVSLTGDANGLMALAVSRAAAKGVVLVAAAGNGGPDAAPAYPAALEAVIAVTAVDADGRRYPEANRGGYIDFAAPGVRVHSPSAPEASATGTSFAAPFVTAVVATEIGREPTVGGTQAADQVRARIAEASSDLGAPGKDDEFGWGLVQSRKGCGG
jgi:Subtilase family